MNDAQTASRFAVVDAHWGEPGSEASFVSRAVAGALSALGRVDVFTPGLPGTARPDGAFDVRLLRPPVPSGRRPDPCWPAPADVEPPDGSAFGAVVVVGASDVGAYDVAGRIAPGRPLLVLVPGRDDLPLDGDAAARLRGADALLTVGAARTAANTGKGEPLSHPGPVHDLGVFVATNRLAAQAPLHGINCEDYILVLAATEHDDTSDPRRQGARAARATWASMASAASWLIARFARAYVATVADGAVTIWHHRHAMTTVPVASRTDLWRLMAWARVMVDPAPGYIVARECVEALLLGTPIVVPAGSRGHAHSSAGNGGTAYHSVAGLLGAVEALQDPEASRRYGNQGRAYALEHFGTAETFVGRMRAALADAGAL